MEDVEYLEEYEDVVLTTNRPKGKLISYNTVSPPIAFNSLYCEDLTFGFGGESVVEDAAPFQMHYDNTEDDDSTIEQESLDTSEISYQDAKQYLSNDEVSTNAGSSQDFNNSITEHSYNSPEKRPPEKKKPRKRRIKNVDAASSDDEVAAVRRKTEKSKLNKISFPKRENTREDKQLVKPTQKTSGIHQKKWIKKRVEKSGPKIEPIKKSVRKKTPTPYIEKFFKSTLSRGLKNKINVKSVTESAKYASQTPSQTIRKFFNTSLGDSFKNKVISKPVRGSHKDFSKISQNTSKPALSRDFKNKINTTPPTGSPKDNPEILKSTFKPSVGRGLKNKTTSIPENESTKDDSNTSSPNIKRVFNTSIGGGFKNRVGRKPGSAKKNISKKPSPNVQKLENRSLGGRKSIYKLAAGSPKDSSEVTENTSKPALGRGLKSKTTGTPPAPESAENVSETLENTFKSALGRGLKNKIITTPATGSTKDDSGIREDAAKPSPGRGWKSKFISTPATGSTKDASDIPKESSKPAPGRPLKNKIISTPPALESTEHVSETLENTSKSALGRGLKNKITSTPATGSKKEDSEIPEESSKPVPGRGWKNKVISAPVTGSTKDTSEIPNETSKLALSRSLKNKITSTPPAAESPNNASENSEENFKLALGRGLKNKMTCTPPTGSPKDTSEKETSKAVPGRGWNNKITSTTPTGSPQNASEVSDNISEPALGRGVKNKITSTPATGSPKNDLDIPDNSSKPALGRGLKNKINSTPAIGSPQNASEIPKENPKPAVGRGRKNQITSTPASENLQKYGSEIIDHSSKPAISRDWKNKFTSTPVTDASKPRLDIQKVFNTSLGSVLKNKSTRTSPTGSSRNHSKFGTAIQTNDLLEKSDSICTETIPISQSKTTHLKQMIQEKIAFTQQLKSELVKKESMTDQQLSPKDVIHTENILEAPQRLHTVGRPKKGNSNKKIAANRGLSSSNTAGQSSETTNILKQDNAEITKHMVILPSGTIKPEIADGINKGEDKESPSAALKRQIKKRSGIITSELKVRDDAKVQKIKLRKLKVRLKKYEIRDIFLRCKSISPTNTTQNKVRIPELVEMHKRDEDSEESLLSPLEPKEIKRKQIKAYSGAKSKKLQKPTHIASSTANNLTLEKTPKNIEQQKSSDSFTALKTVKNKSDLLSRKGTPNNSPSYQMVSQNANIIGTKTSNFLPKNITAGSKLVSINPNITVTKVKGTSPATAQCGSPIVAYVPLQKGIPNTSEMINPKTSSSDATMYGAPVLNLITMPCHLVVETKLLTRREYMRRNLCKTKLFAATGSGSESKEPITPEVSSNKKKIVSEPANAEPTSSDTSSASESITASGIITGETEICSGSLAPAAAVSSSDKVVPRLNEGGGINQIFKKIQNLIDDEISREVTRKLQQISEGFSIGKLTQGKPRRRRIKRDCDLNTANYIYEIIKEYLTSESNGNVETTSTHSSDSIHGENSILPDLDEPRRPPDEQSVPFESTPGPSNTESTSTPISSIQNRSASKKGLFVSTSNIRQLNHLLHAAGLKKRTTLSRSTINKNRRNKSPEYFRFRKIRLPANQKGVKEDSKGNVAQDHTYSTSPPTSVIPTSVAPETSEQTSTPISSQKKSTASSFMSTPITNASQNIKTIFLEPRKDQSTSQQLQGKFFESQNLGDLQFSCLLGSDTNIKRVDNRPSTELIIPDDPDDSGASGEDEHSGSENTKVIHDKSTVSPKVRNITAKKAENVNSNSDYKMVITRTLKKVYIPTTSTTPGEGVVISDLILPDEPNISNVPTEPQQQTNKESRSGVFIIDASGTTKESTDPSTVDPQYTEEYSLDTGYQFKCQKCTVMLSSRPLIQDHVQRTHFKASNTCYLCGVKLDKIHLLQHFLDCHSSASISR